MAKKLLVRDVMIPLNDYLTVYEDDSIYKAVRVFKISMHNDAGRCYGNHELLVIDNENNYTGILTLQDLLKAVELKEHYNDPWLRSASWSWFFIKRIRDAEGMKVKEFMRPIFSVTVSADDDIRNAVKTMFNSDENFVPVLENSVPVGVIRSVDLFWVIDDLL